MVEHLVKHNQLARRALWQLERAQRRRSVRKLRAARRAFENVVEVMSPDHPDRPACLINLGAALRQLYAWSGDPTAIDQLVRVNELVVESFPEMHVERISHRRNLQGLVAKCMSGPRQPDLLSRLVPLAREAAVDPVNRPLYLYALYACMSESFELTQDLDILADLIEVGRERLTSVRDNDPDAWAVLCDLGADLRSLARLSGRPEMLEEAVEIGRRAVDTCPSNHKRRAVCLGALGNSLHELFIQGGRSLATLHKSVALGRQAVVATEGRPDQPYYLTNLGIALRTLFEVTRDLDTLREAARVSRDAVDRAGPDKRNRAKFLANLSAVDQELFKRTGDRQAIVEAVAASREAVELTPSGAPQLAGRLSDLGNALHIMAQGYGDAPETDDVPEADDTPILQTVVQVARSAVEAGAPNGEYRGGWLSNLSVAARTLFERTGDAAALEEAIRAGRDGVAASPAGSTMREAALLALVRALALRPGEPDVVQEMCRCCDELKSATTVPRVGILALLHLGEAAMSADNPDAEIALTAYEEAVALLPAVAPRHLLRPDREYGLGELAGLPAEAASVALSLGRPEHALLLLERARGLLLHEGMASRGDLGTLRRADPCTAEEFVQLRDLLDASDQASVDLYNGSVPPATQHSSRASRHQELAGRWEDLLLRIRRLPGLEAFLLPPTIDSLRPQPVDGPIVLVNASRFRCDALILTGDAPVRTLKLDCSYSALRDRARAFQNFLPAASGASTGPLRPDEHRILGDLAWLWDHIAKPVLTDLGLLSSSPRPAEDAPRIWWCPIGIAAFLPLHAAGRHVGAGPGMPSTVMDHVISSYTSTVNALRHSQERRAAETQPPTSPKGQRQLLVVEASRTPGAPPLPGAHFEAQRLAELVPNLTMLAGPQATHKAVIDALPGHRIAHFACHALTDPRSPALNRLLLHDHGSAPLTAIELSTLDIPHGKLAYLSACETARSSEALADEAVHIATSFQLAGYSHVVGTLWPVADNAAGRIADDFYTGLAPSFNIDDTARVLHRAVCSLRANAPTEPSGWAAHIHLGY